MNIDVIDVNDDWCNDRVNMDNLHDPISDIPKWPNPQIELNYPPPITKGTPHLHPKKLHNFRLRTIQNSCFRVLDLMPPIPLPPPLFHPVGHQTTPWDRIPYIVDFIIVYQYTRNDHRILIIGRQWSCHRISNTPRYQEEFIYHS